MTNVKILTLLFLSLGSMFTMGADMGKTEECVYPSIYRYLKDEFHRFNDQALDLSNMQYMKERARLKNMLASNKNSGKISSEEHGKLSKILGEF